MDIQNKLNFLQRHYKKHQTSLFRDVFLHLHRMASYRIAEREYRLSVKMNTKWKYEMDALTNEDV